MENNIPIMSQDEITRRAGRFASYMIENHNKKIFMQWLLRLIGIILFLGHGLFVADTPREVVIFSSIIMLIMSISIPHIERTFCNAANEWANKDE